MRDEIKACSIGAAATEVISPSSLALASMPSSGGLQTVRVKMPFHFAQHCEGSRSSTFRTDTGPSQLSGCANASRRADRISRKTTLIVLPITICRAKAMMPTECAHRLKANLICLSVTIKESQRLQLECFPFFLSAAFS